MTNEESKQRFALFAKERQSVVRRQKGRIGNRRILARRACASSLSALPYRRSRAEAGNFPKDFSKLRSDFPVE